MFGYLRVYAPGLRVSEYEAYKSAYCGFCKQLGKDYGQLWRLSLSYDFAFVKLLSEALREQKIIACKQRCVIHPFRKRYCMACRSEDKLLSAAAVMLVDAKIKDNLADSKWYTKWFWQLAGLFAKPSVGKAAKDYPALKESTDRYLADQAKAEQNGSLSKDAAADPTGQWMAGFLSLLDTDPTQKRVLHELGYQIGRYVYFTDALDDLKKDAKKGNFNPFLLGIEKIEDAALADVKEKAIGSINRCIGGAIDAYELLTLHHMKPILDNILYFGLQHTAQNAAMEKRKEAQQEMEIY